MNMYRYNLKKKKNNKIYKNKHNNKNHMKTDNQEIYL